MNGKPREVNAWENATHTHQGWMRNGDRDSSDTITISKVQCGHPVAEVTSV